MRKTLATLALTGAMVLSGCERINQPKEYTTIKGTVFSERYMPASGGGFMNAGKDSQYSFSLDTKNGRKAFEVVNHIRSDSPKKESIDAMIDPGTKTEVQVEKGTENQTFYAVFPEQIKVIQ